MSARVPTLLEKARWNALAVGTGSISRLLAGIVVARQLGPELTGQFAFLLWLTETATLFFSIGLPNALIRYIAVMVGQADTARAGALVRWCLWAYVALTVVAAGATYLIARYFLELSLASRTPLTTALALLVAVQLWAGLTQALLTGLQEFRTYAQVVLVSSLMLLIGQGMGAFWWGLVGVICGTVAAHAAGIALFLRMAFLRRGWHMYEPTGTMRIDRAFLRYSLNAWLAALISSVTWGRAELFFIEKFSTHQEAAYFAVGLVFASVIVQAVSLMSGALLPHLSYLVGADQLARVSADYRRLTTAIALFAFPLSVGGVVLMPELITMVFGERYTGAVPAARWLIATGLLSFSTVGSAVIYSLGDAKVIRNWGIFGACLLVLGCVSLVPAYGAAGAAATRLGVQTLLIAIGTYLLRYRYQQPFPAKAVASAFLAAICSGLVARAIVTAADGGGTALALGIAGGGAAYGVLLRMFRVLTREDADAMRGLLARFPLVGRLASETILRFLAPR